MSITLPLPKERQLFFYEQVEQDSIQELTKQIIEINEADRQLERLCSVFNLTHTPEPIKIYIDSYGGVVYQILGLIGIIEKSATPIHTYVTGTAMSAGFLLSICGHKRFAYPHATFMVHQLSSWSHGKLEEMKEDLKENERLQSVIDSIIFDKTKLTPARLEKVYKRKSDWFVDCEQAIKWSLIDEII